MLVGDVAPVNASADAVFPRAREWRPSLSAQNELDQITEMPDRISRCTKLHAMLAYAVCEGIEMKNPSRFRINRSIVAASIGSLLAAGLALGAEEALIVAAKKEGELTWYT